MKNLVNNAVGSNIIPDNIVNIMIKSEEHWQLVSNFITQLHQQLSIEERHRKEQRSSNSNAEVG